MKKKETMNREFDKSGVKKSLTGVDYLTDGVAGVGFYLMQGVMSVIIYFYTEKLGIAVGFASVMLTIPRVADAFTDIIMGNILDKHRFKNGRFRPWLLWMAAPISVSLLLTFLMPPNMAPVITGIYIVFASLLTQSVFGTAFLIPYISLMGARTKSTEEREKLNLLRSVWQIIPAVLSNMLFIPLANAMGGDRFAYIKVITIYSAICCATIFITYFFSKELPEAEGEHTQGKEKSNLLQDLAMLTKNSYWVRISLVCLVVQLTVNMLTTANTYYAQYVLGDDNLVSLSGLGSMAAMLLGVVLLGLLRDKVGATNMMRFAWGFSAATYILLAIFPHQVWAYVLSGSASGFTGIATWGSMLAFVNNCAEYNQYKFGKDMRGITNSSISFVQKISISLGTLVVGLVMSAAGFVSGAAAQTPGAVNAIIVICSIVPALLYASALLIFARFDMEKVYPEIAKKLEAGAAAKD